MAQFLMFRLYGPMAAWGDVAVGEFRPSHTHPTRTSVLGLVAAALGIRRHQEEELLALDDSIKLAVRLDAPGEVLRDYHTTQVPPAQNKVVHYTRQDELANDKLNTILSSRDYRCDAAATVVLHSQSEAFNLAVIEAALRQPKLPLYLGRKSCPLALPLSPKLIEAQDLPQALADYSPTQEVLNVLTGDLWGYGQLAPAEGMALFWEEGMQVAELRPAISYPRRDRLRSRQRWQYDERIEHRAQLAGKEA